MRAIIQRVQHASVKVNGETVGKINHGLLVLVGFQPNETSDEYDWLINKILNLRIFNDEQGVMNLSCTEIKGELLVVSQVTLYASTKKGNRPSYIEASPPAIAIEQYNNFIQKLKSSTSLKIETGIFGTDMKVELLNDGPVTITIDTKNKA